MPKEKQNWVRGIMMGEEERRGGAFLQSSVAGKCGGPKQRCVRDEKRDKFFKRHKENRAGAANNREAGFLKREEGKKRAH